MKRQVLPEDWRPGFASRRRRGPVATKRDTALERKGAVFLGKMDEMMDFPTILLGKMDTMLDFGRENGV